MMGRHRLSLLRRHTERRWADIGRRLADTEERKAMGGHQKTMEGHRRENDDGPSSRDDGQTLREKDDGQTSKRDRRGTDIEERKTMGLVFLFCLFVYLLVCLSVCQKRYFQNIHVYTYRKCVCIYSVNIIL